MIACTARWTLVLAFLLKGSVGHAQYFQFSQYNFTQQRINPALAASSNYAMAGIIYRNQATQGGFHLNSNFVEASYPLYAGKGYRWAGVGLTLMDDRSGVAGIFNTQEAAVSYAVNVQLAKGQTLSLGVKALHQVRKMDLNGLVTGSQYIPDRGFDETAGNGEALGMVRQRFTTFNTGLHWQQTTKKGEPIAHWGISFFDFNKPDDSFLGTASQLASTLVMSGGFRMYEKDKIGLYPEVLFTRGASTTVINTGFITRYAIQTYSRSPSDHVDIITKYVWGRSAVLGIQLHKEKLSLGLSYDFPLLRSNVANTGAVEIALRIKRLVEPRFRSKRNTARRTPVKPGANRVTASRTRTPSTAAADSLSRARTTEKESLSTRLKHKQDSLNTHALAGDIRHEPLILERATLRFNFEFNSTQLDEEATAYLDDLGQALMDNPELKIKLVGHTDNIGSDKFNLRLSLHRAETIKNYLIAQGVEAGRILTEGKGMREPLNKNVTDEERALNRRVEMTILYQ
jgi:type IX secretion system PorP/SprF family membrane protein